MKKLILALFLTFSSSAFADDKCEGLSNLANTIAESRMNGMSKTKAIQVAESSELPETATALVNMAFELDLMGTNADRRVEVNTFTAKVYFMCVEAENED